MPTSVYPESPKLASKKTQRSDEMKGLLQSQSNPRMVSSHSFEATFTSSPGIGRSHGKPVRSNSIADPYQNRGGWARPSVLVSSTRSDSEFGIWDALNISAGAGTASRFHADVDLESSVGRKKYLAYDPIAKPSKSKADLSGPLNLQGFSELNQKETGGRDKAVLRASTSARDLRKSLSNSFGRSASWKRSSISLLTKKSHLSKPNIEKDVDQGSLIPNGNYKWWHFIFLFSFVSALACIITLWAPYPIGARMSSEVVAATPLSNGCKGLTSCICPRETICADDLLSMILLTISRFSAWFDYPLYICLYLTKCNSLNNYLQKTMLRCWIGFSDYHKVHRLFGIIVGIESACHSFFHLMRWARRNDDIKLLWTSQTGITGLVVLLSSWFIIFPMTVPYLKKAMPYELRKGLHYLFILWAVGLMYHAPQRIFWMIGTPLFLFAADKAAELFSKTFLIESAHVEKLSDSICTITFNNPPGFGKQNSAYVYVMLPWISRYQFHAFTVFPGSKPNTSSLCINKCGDWTQSLMKEISTPTHKPMYVTGPYLSPFSSPAMDSENLIAVASGIGVTPAISLIKQYSCTTRRMNLIWICRDAALVEHFLQSLEIGTNGHVLVYYTGKQPLFLNNDLPPNVCIFYGRPDLEKTISSVIYSIANDVDLPEDFYSKNSIATKATPEIAAKLVLVRALSIYSIDQLFEYAVSASVACDEELPPQAAASFVGVLTMIDDLLGYECELLWKKAVTSLDLVDSYGSCILNKDMFEDFMELMMGEDGNEPVHQTDSVQQGKQPGMGVPVSSHNGAISGMSGVKKILQGGGKYSSKNWNMLYCGGSEAVLAQLKAYKYKYSIGLSVEKFDW